MQKKTWIGLAIAAVIILLVWWFIVSLTTYTITIKYYAPTWSPDGKKIAFFLEKKLLKTYHYRVASDTDTLEYDLWLCTMDCDGKNLLIISKMPGDEIAFENTSHIDWNIDGKMALSIGIGGIYTINEDGSNLQRIFPARNRYEYPKNPSLHPDGSKLVFEWDIYKAPDSDVEEIKNIVEMDLETKEIKVIYENAYDPLWNKKNEDLIAFTTLDNKEPYDHRKIGIYSSDSGKVTKIGEMDLSAQQWSEDGEWLIIAGGRKKIHIGTEDVKSIGVEIGGNISPNEKMCLGSSSDTGVEIYWANKKPRDDPSAEILFKSSKIYKSILRKTVEKKCLKRENI